MTENKKTKRNVAIIVIGLILVVAVATLSYALWTRNFTETGVNKNIYDCFTIAYSQTSGEGVTLEHGYPQTDEEGMQNNPYEVQIKNSCKTVASYNVILNEQTDSTLSEQYLKVATDGDVKLLSSATETTKRVIDNYNNKKSYIINSGVLASNQTKTLQIRSWMDKDTSVENGTNKSFTFKITIEATSGINSDLKIGILGKEYPVITTTPDFKKGYPNSDDTSLSGLYLDYDDDGTSYYFRGAVENNYVKLGTSKQDDYLYIVGKGTGSSATLGTREAAEAECDKYNEIDYGYETVQACKDAIVTEPMQISGQSILWRIVRINGDGTIRLVTDNPIEGSAFNTDYLDRKYVGYTYGNTACTKTSPCKSTYTGSGTFTNSNGGTNSTIKSYLENWYHTTLGELDSKIAQTTYCNDTSYGSGDESGTLNYGTYKRIVTDKKPSFKCPDPTKQSSGTRDYGGVYKLKVGLLTADEMTYAGMSYNIPYATRENYLLSYGKEKDYPWYMWSMSPYYSSSSGAVEFNVIAGSGFNHRNDVYYADSVVRPVINLNADTLASGNGTKESPFIVE